MYAHNHTKFYSFLTYSFNVKFLLLLRESENPLFKAGFILQNISSYGISFVSGNEDVSFDWKYKQVVFLLKWTICMLITQFHYEMMFGCLTILTV